MKQCIICKKDFNPATKKQRFCSNSCRQKNYRKEINEMIAEIKQKKAKIKPVEEVLAIKTIEYPQKATKPEIKPQNGQPVPPNGLVGMALIEWKIENWE